jgi:hypothetical protein
MKRLLRPKSSHRILRSASDSYFTRALMDESFEGVTFNSIGQLVCMDTPSFSEPRAAGVKGLI